MSNVQFENENFGQYRNTFDKPHKGLVSFLIKKEIVKTESQANLVLLGIIFVCLAIILYKIFFTSNLSTIPQKEIEKIDQRQYIIN